MFISYKILIRLVYLLFVLVFLGVHIMKKAILYVHGKGGTHTEAEFLLYIEYRSFALI